MRYFSRTDAADALGIAPTTLDSWVRDGAPVVEKGGKGNPSQYDISAVFRWQLDREVKRAIAKLERSASADDLDALKARRLAIMNEQSELELAKAKGEVALVSEFAAVQAGRFALIRQNLMNVPARAAVELIGETDEARFKAVLRREIASALDRAASEPIRMADDADDEDDADAA